MTTPYLAQNLVALRNEINMRWPARDYESDGWIGDAKHQAEVSDHNPDSRGCVHAIDVDVDGIDPMTVVRAAIAHGSCEYVIWNRQIWERDNGFKPDDYTLEDPHTSHIHVSGRHGTTYENDTTSWGIGGVDMSGLSDTDAAALIWRIDAIFYNKPAVAGGPHVNKPEGVNQLHTALEVIRVQATVGTPLTQEQINAAIAANVPAIGASVASHIKVA